MKTYFVPLLATIASIGAALAEPDQPPVADLRRELEEILASDQALRRDARKLEEEQGIDSPALKELWAKQKVNDTKNIARVQEILETYGWPDRKTYGPLAGTAVFLVIQHADLEIQKKYLPMVREAAEKGNTQLSSVALLEDRILMREGKKQNYGSQLHRTEAGKLEMWPVEDEAHLDERRAKMGLKPIAEYLSHFGVTYTKPPEAQPGATDNPDDAQRLREDH